MDDLTQKLQEILADPQTMGQLQGLLGSLGGNEPPKEESPPPSSGPDLSSLLGALGGLSSQKGALAPPSGGGNGGITPETLSLVTRLAPLLGQVNREDDATRLLRALRPLLSEARQKKVDEAVKILQLLRLLPLLKESGVFSGLLSGLV